MESNGGQEGKNSEEDVEAGKPLSNSHIAVI